MSNSSSYRVGVRVDGSAAGLTRAAQEAQAAFKVIGASAQHSSKESEAALKVLGRNGIAEYKRMAQARQMLGVRSEREIQREMQRTEAAYGRLARAGAMSWREQVLAAQKMREEVTRLTNEMGRMTGRQKLVAGMKGVAAVGAGVGVTAAVMAPKLNKAMDYETRLSVVANTAADVGAKEADRQREKQAAGDAITRATRYGGGTRDQAMDSYNEMVGKGSTFVGDLPRQLLPEIMKAATATASTATDMSRIAAAGIQNFGMPKSGEAAKEWFNIGAIGAKLGGFEMRNQAQYLPEQMALAGNVGMSGKRDFANLVMLNQAAEKTAGTPDKAAVNVKQFLTDIGSEHFRHRAMKATGVNFTKYAVENQLKNGTGMIDSAMELVDKQVQKHPAYQQLQARLAKAYDPAQRDQLMSAMKMVEGSVSSRFFHNQESAQVVAAYRANRELMKDGQRQALSGVDEIGLSFGHIAGTPGFKADQRRNEQDIAMQTSMDKLTPTIGWLNDEVTGLMRKYPGYTTAVIGATTAVVALAGSAAAAALLNGGKLSSLAAVPGVAGALGVAKMAGGVGLAALGGYGVGTLAYKGLLEGNAGGDFIGRGIASTASFFGSKNAEEALRMEDAYQQRLTQQQRLQALLPLLPLQPQSLADRLGTTGTASLLPQQDLRGEILVRVTGAPGLSVQAETRTNSPRIPMRTDVGRTMMGSGQ